MQQTRDVLSSNCHCPNSSSVFTQLLQSVTFRHLRNICSAENPSFSRHPVLFLNYTVKCLDLFRCVCQLDCKTLTALQQMHLFWQTCRDNKLLKISRACSEAAHSNLYINSAILSLQISVWCCRIWCARLGLLYLQSICPNMEYFYNF